MFKTKCDGQMEVYVYFFLNIARDIISKTVLKVKIC